MSLEILIAFLREKFPPNRVVLLLTPPTAFLAGLVSAYLSDHLPLIAEQVSKDQLTLIFLAVAASVVTMAYKYIDGWQKHERNLALALIEPVLLEPTANPQGELEMGPIPDDHEGGDDLLRAQADKPAGGRPDSTQSQS